jgi:hypothetical protein
VQPQPSVAISIDPAPPVAVIPEPAKSDPTLTAPLQVASVQNQTPPRQTQLQAGPVAPVTQAAVPSVQAPAAPPAAGTAQLDAGAKPLSKTLTALLPENRPLVVAARELNQTGVPAGEKPPGPDTSEALTEKADSGRLPQAAVETASVTPGAFHPGYQVAMATGGLLAAAMLFYIMRRSRPAPRGSLITQSLERRSGR